jgi:hypothetical protein
VWKVTSYRKNKEVKKSNIGKEKLQKDTQRNEKPRKCTEIIECLKSNSKL